MLFRNTVAQSASFALGYLFSFLLAPVMISRLGLNAFGVWAVTGAFASYAGLLDLGVGRSLSRFIAVYDVAGDDRRIRECVGLGLLIVTTVGLLAAIIAAAGASFLSHQLGVLNPAEMRIVVLASVGIWTFSGFAGVFTSVGIGKRQMVPPNVSNAIGVSVNFAFSIAALIVSRALPLYASANAAAAFVAIVPSIFAMRYVWHSPYLAIPSRGLVKEVLSFSLKNQVAWFADLINLQTDKVIIALLVDVRAAAVYEIGSRVVIAVRSAAILSVSAMIPTATSRIIEEGREAIANMYRRYTLLSCATSFPLFVLASVSAPFLLVAWLGSVPGDAGLIVPILCSAYLVNGTTGVGTSIAIGAGNPGMAASNSASIAIVNVILTVALAPLFGLWGVVAGTALALILGSMAFNRRFLKFFALSERDLWSGVLPPAALALGVGIPPALLAIFIGLPSGRPLAIALLAISTALYIFPYWILATRRGLLPEKLTFPPRRRGASASVPVA